MVGEVADDADRPGLGDHLEPLARAGEGGKGLADRRLADPGKVGADRGEGGVVDVVAAGDHERERSEPAAPGRLERECESRVAGRLPDDPPVAGRPPADAHHPAGRCRHGGGDHGVVRRGHDRPRRVDPGHQAGEGGDHRCKIGEDVAMVEFDVGDGGERRPVVEEFWGRVEIGGLVLVALDDQRCPGPGQPGALAEVPRDAADQEARTGAGDVVDPGQHRGGGRLAVGAGDDMGGMPGADHVPGDGRREGDHRRAAGGGGAEFGVPGRYGGAEHDRVEPGPVGSGAEIVHGERQDRDGMRGEDVAHRRMRRVVGAADDVAELLEHHGEAGHA